MIDAHHHLWQIGKHDCQWPTAALPGIYRDFDVDDFLPLAQAAGITGSVLVQSQASDKDTDYLLAVASRNDVIKAVVGWVDLASVSASTRIAQLAQHKKLRGLRPMLQGLADDAWLLKPELEPALAAMDEHGLRFDALVFTRHLPHLLVFAKRYPTISVVIDHGAKPPIAAADQKEFVRWSESIAKLAEMPQVYCKISGLLTEANAQQREEDFRPYIAHLYRSFGAQRLMWGSDWPVLNLAANRTLATYGDWLTLAQQLIPTIDVAELKGIFSETAKIFYGLAR